MKIFVHLFANSRSSESYLSYAIGSLIIFSLLGYFTNDQFRLNENACLNYESRAPEGSHADTICTTIIDGLENTNYSFVSVLNQPLFNPEMDMLFISTDEGIPFSDCLPLNELSGNFNSTEIWMAPINGTGVLTVDDNTPCFTYSPNPGQNGNFIDTMALIICDDLEICDTTVLIASVVPANCPEIIVDETASITVVECFELGFYCLPINPVDLFNYQITDNGEPYFQGFAACDFDSILFYQTNLLDLQAPDGPYELVNWAENGENHSIPVFEDLEQLLDSMNVWDPEGDWIINSAGDIQGGTESGTYGILEINQIPFPFFSIDLPLATAAFPNGVQIAVDTGFHEIILNDIFTGCQDTILIDVECINIQCPEFYDGPTELLAADCDSLTEICLNVPITDFLNYTVFDNGPAYQGPLAGCEIDTLLTYPTDDFSAPGVYDLESWIVNGQLFSFDGFTNVSELIDSLNAFDPVGNWSLLGNLIIGGAAGNTYGSLVIFENGNVLAEILPGQLPVANNISIQVDTGFHELIVRDTTTGCIDTIGLNINCEAIGGMSIDTLLSVFEGMVDTFCLDVSNLGTISSIINVCPGESDGNAGFMIIPGTTCIEYSGDVLGLDTFCVEVCDFNLGICDTTNIIIEVIPEPDTFEVDMLLGFSDTLCIDTTGLPGNITSFNNFCFQDDINLFLNEDTYCVEFMGISLGTDTICIQICDDLGFCNETFIIVNIESQTIDSIETEIVVGMANTDTICIDTTELAGTITLINNYCLNQSGTFVDFDILDDYCVSFEGLLPEGSDTACIEICDEFGFCDTTILVVNTLENMAIDPPVAIDDDTITVTNTPVDINILDNDTLNSSLIDIEIISDPENGVVVLNPNFDVTYIPNEGFCGAVDSFIYFIETLGGTDMATVFIEVLCDELVIYNGISPNEDGINDVFTIGGINNFPDNEVRIFNRWGNQVFLRKGYTNDAAFDGTWQGKSLPDGTYFYLIEITDENGETMKFNGYLQIHR